MGYAVELDFGGRTYRWEDQDLSLVESFDFFNTSPRLRSVSLALHVEADVSELISKGYRLDASECRILDADNSVQLAGLCQNPIWGFPEEPIRFTVREVPFDTQAVFPGPYAVEQVVVDGKATAEAIAVKAYQAIYGGPSVNAYNYDVTVCVRKDLGTLPPVIIGNPGALDESNVNLVWEGSPAIYIDQTPGDETLLACCHQVEPSAGKIWVNGPKPSGTRVWVTADYTTSQDLAGRTITLVDISTASVPPGVFDLTATSEDWYLAFIGTGDIKVSGLPSGGGDLAKAFLGQCFGLRIDNSRLGEVISFLNGYRFSGYINGQINPWEYFQEQVLKLLPVSAVSGPDGLYLAPWFPDAPSVDQFVEGRQVSIDGQLQYERTTIINEITFNYQYEADSEILRQVVEVSPRNNAYAELSRQAFGIRAMVLESQIVDDAATAQRIANWMIRAYSFPPKRLSLRVDSSRFSSRRVGDSVDVQLPSLSIDQKGLICEIERQGRPVMRVDVLLFDEHVRT